MRRCGLWAAIFSLATFPTTVALGEKLADYPFPGQWIGAAYADDTSQEFTHCAASADYNSGVSLIVSVSSEYSWNIGFVANAWQLRGQETEISYRFDDRVWRSGTATIADPAFAILPMPDDERVVDLFRRSSQMQVVLAGSTYYFDLDGTAKLVVALVSCVETFVGTRAGAKGTTTEVAAPSSPPTPKSDGGSGTGIIVSEGGYVLTNQHVVEGCATVSVLPGGTAARDGRVVRADATNDLALVQVGGQFMPSDVAVFRAGTALMAGEVVAVYGFPLAGLLSQSGNIVAGNITALSGLGDDVRFVQISAPVQPGNSGGPLIDSSGLVVGVVRSRLSDMAMLGATGSLPQNVSFAIRGNVATSFLEAHAIPYKSSARGADLTLVDIASRARRFTVMVSCSN